MSNFRRAKPTELNGELETVTDWRVVAAGGGVLLAFLAVPCVMALLPATRPVMETSRVAALEEKTAPEPAAPTSSIAAIKPQLSFPPVDPYPVRKSPAPPEVEPSPVSAAATAVASVSPSTGRIDDAVPRPIEDVSANRAVTPRRILKPLTEEEAIAFLSTDVPEIKLEIGNGATKDLFASKETHPLIALLPKREDLKGLPVREVADCQLRSEAAQRLKFLSREARQWIVQEGPRPRGAGLLIKMKPSEVEEYSHRLALRLARMPEWNREAAVPTLEQVLQSEEMPLRLVLVRQLAKISGATATAALARRVLYECSDHVRQVALEALKSRPKGEARPTFIAGLRYPWPTVADRAAEALVSLADTDATELLGLILNLPDPSAPIHDPKTNKWAVSELVRINHLGNCALCHAPSKDKNDILRAPVPIPGKRLPVLYYAPDKNDTIRADVTYLRQDFSVALHVDGAAPWPADQRFDFILRSRELPDVEGAELTAAGSRDYPQKRAVQYALHELRELDACSASAKAPKNGAR
jgi:hypothetical protein